MEYQLLVFVHVVPSCSVFACFAWYLTENGIDLLFLQGGMPVVRKHWRRNISAKAWCWHVVVNPWD